MGQSRSERRDTVRSVYRAFSALRDGVIRTGAVIPQSKAEWSVEDAAAQVAQTRGCRQARALHLVVEALLEGRVRAYRRGEPDARFTPDDLRRLGVVRVE